MSSNQSTSENNSSEWNAKLLYSSNIAISAFITTIAVAAIKLPSDKIIQTLTKNNNILNHNDLKLAALYAGGTTFMKFNILRSCYCVHSKHVASTAKTHENSGVSEKPAVEESKLENQAKKALDIGLLALGETLLTHIPDHKTNLAQQNIKYQNNVHNLANMFRAGLGLRFTSATFNLVCLTHLQNLYLNMLFEDKNTTTQHTLTGALSGVTAGVITYPLKQLQTQMSVGVVEQNERLTYPKTFQLIKNNCHELKNTSAKNTLMSISPKLFIRCTQNALLFGTITGVNFILGPSPMTDMVEFGQKQLKKG